MNDHFELLIMGQQFKKLYEKCYGHIMQTYGLKKIDIDVYIFYHIPENRIPQRILQI